MTPPDADWPTADLVAVRAESAPDATALVDAGSGRAWSYRELSTGPVAALAAGLLAADLAPGDHVGVVAEPGVGLAQLVHAAARAGVVLVPLSPDAPAGVLAERAAVADVDLLVVDAATEATARDAFDGPVHSIDELDRGPADGPIAGEADPYAWARDDVQWLVFTSGTTGGPKAVALTAGNLVASAAASAERLGVEPDDRWLAPLPMHHVGGLAPLSRSALYGTTAVVQGGFDAEATAEAMSARDVTGVSLVPTMLNRLLDAGWTPPASLRFVLLGGAPASPELVDRCEAAGVPVHPTYGTTETASQVATARPAEAFEHRGTVGRPLPGVEVAVVGAEAGPLPPGEAGELVVDGPTVARGYYGDAASTAAAFTDRGFRTGDRGRLDEAGRLWVAGRADAAIVTGGETVQPDDVEAALRAHPAVDAAAVVGVDDAEWGEVVAALVTGRGLDGNALREHCRERLEPHAVPKLVVPVDELPRTASGTVDRPAVRERLAAARARDGL